MRYKQDLAKFLSIADGARLIQERAGITEDEAREDIVLAVQDYAVRCLLWDVSKGARRHLDFEHIKRELLRSLASDQVDWGQSVVRHRHSFSHRLVEIEVSRSDLDHSWPEADAVPRINESKRPDDADPAIPRKTETLQRNREIYKLYTATRKEKPAETETEIYSLMRTQKPHLFTNRLTAKHKEGISDLSIERIIRHQQRQ